jgi:hypothetical protein
MRCSGSGAMLRWSVRSTVGWIRFTRQPSQSRSKDCAALRCEATNSSVAILALPKGQSKRRLAAVAQARLSARITRLEDLLGL